MHEFSFTTNKNHFSSTLSANVVTVENFFTTLASEEGEGEGESKETKTRFDLAQGSLQLVSSSQLCK